MAKKNRRPEALPILRIEIEHADGTAVLNPNEVAMLAAGGGTGLLRPLPGMRSVLSAAPAILYRSDDLEIALTPDELCRLAGLDLTPEEAKALDQRYGDAFEWHDDFYDQETWESLQPREIGNAGRPGR